MNSYVSTGMKLLRHLDQLKKFQEGEKIFPISLQVAPTSRCNLNCSFCSNANREKHEDLDSRKIIDFIDRAKPLTVEWTGGGDPTMYVEMNDLIKYANKRGFQQGFITNGIQLVEKIPSLKVLKWIRISLNSLDYVKDIEIPKDYYGTLGFSYVINEKTNSNTIVKLKQYIEKYQPKYVRVVPDCQTTSEQLDQRNEVYSQVVQGWGSPVFYQAKKYSQPKRCSSVVLNDTSERTFHEKFRWFSMEEYLEAIKYPPEPFDSGSCTSCVFGQQNELLEAVLNSEMENFV
jgi:organic radical activating enzyme